jgi:hypothetical protein
MPTEITRTPISIVEHSRTLEINSRSISPLAIAATLLFVVVHLIGGIMLGHSQVRSAAEPAAFAALDDAVRCSVEGRQRDPSLANDWSLDAD